MSKFVDSMLDGLKRLAYKKMAIEELSKYPLHPKCDLAQFVRLYYSFGVECRIRVKNEPLRPNSLEPEHRFSIRFEQSDTLGLESDATVSDKFDGWSSMRSDVYFDQDGKFVGQLFWS